MEKNNSEWWKNAGSRKRIINEICKQDFNTARKMSHMEQVKSQFIANHFVATQGDEFVTAFSHYALLVVYNDVFKSSTNPELSAARKTLEDKGYKYSRKNSFAYSERVHDFALDMKNLAVTTEDKAMKFLSACAVIFASVANEKIESKRGEVETTLRHEVVRKIRHVESFGEGMDKKILKTMSDVDLVDEHVKLLGLSEIES